MKRTVLLMMMIVTATILTNVSAQNIFFSSKEGMILEYANLNAEGKTLSYALQTIRGVEGSGANLKINYSVQVLDQNHKPLGDKAAEIPYTVTVNDGAVEWDLKSLAGPGSENSVEITGDKLRLPATLAAGQKIDDATIKITVKMGIKITSELKFTEQECLAVEDVTVPAGTFKCHKLTQKISTTAMRKTMVTKTLTWYAPGIGTVKSETYNDKDELQVAVQLQSVKQ